MDLLLLWPQTMRQTAAASASQSQSESQSAIDLIIRLLALQVIRVDSSIRPQATHLTGHERPFLPPRLTFSYLPPPYYSIFPLQSTDWHFNYIENAHHFAAVESQEVENN